MTAMTINRHERKDEDMNKFVYVMSEADRDKLLKLGYKLIRSDEVNKVFAFENKKELAFECGEHPLEAQDVNFVLSSVLTL